MGATGKDNTSILIVFIIWKLRAMGLLFYILPDRFI